MNFDPLIKAKLVFDGETLSIPEELGTPSPDQMQGTVYENLVELAGRTCYDSLGKGRPSEDYHKHLLDVGHYSVHEHCHFTTFLPEVRYSESLFLEFCNLPDVYIKYTSNGYRLTYNLRHVLEWQPESIEAKLIYNYLYDITLLNFRYLGEVREKYKVPFYTRYSIHGNVHPVFDPEVFISMYLSGSRGMCYDDKTEVLTADGWKFWDHVTLQDKFATLNPISHILEYQSPSLITKESYHGRMYLLESSRINLCVTPDHDMYVKSHQDPRRPLKKWNKVKAKNLIAKSRVQYKKNAIWYGEQDEYFKIPDVSTRSINQFGGVKEILCRGRNHKREDLAEFLGYWIAEGNLDHTVGSGYFLSLSQNYEGRCYDEILSVVKRLGYKFTIRNNGRGALNARIRVSVGKALYDLLKIYSLAENKRVPIFMKNWSSRCHQIFINAYLAGDGSFTKRGSGEGYTVSVKLADDLQESALKAGWTATLRQDPIRTDLRMLLGRELRSNFPINVISFSKKRLEPMVNSKYRQDSIIDYDGMVYCATVPNGILFVRRNGRCVWSGNSHEQVRHRSNISQRSTRYVDESSSRIVEHPLITKFLAEENGNALTYTMGSSESASKKTYDKVVVSLQSYLELSGIDKTSARKQARGAARNYLGNGLFTEMIFTASVKQWQHILFMRCSDFADAEIRLLYNQVLNELKNSKHTAYFSQYSLKPAKDGIGHVLHID